MSQNKKLVSVIILAENAPLEAVNENITNVLNQTYKSLDIIVSLAKGRPDLQKFQERWNGTLNIRLMESGQGLETINVPLANLRGDIVFYKSMGPIVWMPRHVEHHVDLLKWDNKAEWSFSFIEFKNVLEQQQPYNVLNWRIEPSPAPNTIVIDELCHYSNFKPAWDQFVTPNGFLPGRCLDVWKAYRVAVPTEITVQTWVDPRPPVPQLGAPQSEQNVNEEVVESTNGQLEVKIEFPTLVGNAAYEQHNKSVLKRMSEISTENIKKIAIKRTIGMGDVILVEPVIKALRERYKDAEIALFTSKERSCASIVEFFESRPDVTIGLEGEGELTRDFLYSQKGFDIRIDLDLSYESRKNINYVDAYFRIAGFTDEVVEINEMLQVVNPVGDSEKVPTLKFDEPRMIAEKYVTVEIVGSGWAGKEWNPEKWKSILKKIYEQGYAIAFVSNQQKIANFDEAQHTFYTNSQNDFKTMLNYLRYAEFHIGADNGPMHVAAAFGKKCFIIAGAAIPAYTTKNPNVYQCTLESLHCLHCKGRQFYNPAPNGGITFVARCDNPEQYACMTKLEEAHVLERFQDFYAKITA